MKQFSKRVFVHVAVIILVFMVTACVTQPAPEVVEAVVAEAAVVAEVACVTQPAPEVVVAVVTEAAVVAEAAAAPMAAAETFRIIGTNGLFELATATYAGGLGFTEVSAIVDYARAGYPTLVIDAGSNNVSLPDLHLGLEDGAALAAVLNAIGYDAMTPGIADLLFGAEGLQMLNAATSLQVVSANMEQNGELIFAPSALVEVGDLTIGILGLTSPHANKMGVEVSPVLSDLIATVEAAVNGLEKQGADFIVALTNMGFERAGFSDADLDWTAEYLSGHVDLIIDGMGSIPYQEIRGTTMYVQLGGSAYIGGLEITVQGDTVVAVDQLIITQDMIAGLEPNAEVAAILAAEGKRLAMLAEAAAAMFEVAVASAEEAVVEEATPVEEAVVEAETVNEEVVIDSKVEPEVITEAVSETKNDFEISRKTGQGVWGNSNEKQVPAVSSQVLDQVNLAPNQESPRFALVIGNSEYEHTSRLINPVNDATDVGMALWSIGFDTEVVLDADIGEMEDAVLIFAEKLRRNSYSAGIFYYAGHAVQYSGVNYLLPVDADIHSENELRRKALSAQEMLDYISEARNSFNMVVLDACRDNPFAGSFRSIQRGLAVTAAAPPETLVVYATDAGNVANDGEGRNSPFTEAFLANVMQPGIDVELMIRNVMAEVQQKTNKQQRPWKYSSLTSAFQLVPDLLEVSTTP